jgi:hypothetical protein
MYVTSDKVDPSDAHAMAMAFVQMNSDVCLACPTTELLDAMGATPSYFYHFTWNPLPTLAGLAFHAGELPTLFGYLINPLRAAVYPAPGIVCTHAAVPLHYTHAVLYCTHAVDAGLSAEFMGRFTDFARTGSVREYFNRHCTHTLYSHTVLTHCTRIHYRRPRTPAPWRGRNTRQRRGMECSLTRLRLPP